MVKSCDLDGGYRICCLCNKDGGRKVTVKFLYRPISNKKQYSSNRRNYKDIKFIVIHDTANRSVGADADNHYRYLEHANRYGSAHYYVDDNKIIQVIGDSRSAWSVGDTWARKYRTRTDVNNYNSLNLELCINSDGSYEKAFYNLIELTKNLMFKFGIPPDRVVRHFDASGKPCPGSMKDNNWQKWKEFQLEICKPMKLKLDLDKDSVAIELKEELKGEEKRMNNGDVGRKSEYEEKLGLHIIKTSPDNIYQQIISGKTLREVGAYGINGTFFDTKKPASPDSCWQIAINNGKFLGKNSHVNSYNRNVRRGTFYIANGRCGVVRINNATELPGGTTFAVGGMMLLPIYDPNAERVLPDILRTTNHTAIGYKGDEVYLITTKDRCTMYTLYQRLYVLKLDGAVALDGGGSTQMYYEGNRGNHTSRKLNSMIGIKKL